MKTENEKAWEQFADSVAKLASLGLVQAGEKLNVKAEDCELDVKIIRVLPPRVQQQQQQHQSMTAREEAYFIHGGAGAFV